jgi:hypothetical protein
MESGLKVLNEDSELFIRNASKMGKGEKDALKDGVVRAIRKKIETSDGRNTTNIFRVNKDKFKSILSEKEYNNLMQEADSVDKLYKLRNKIVGNSRTATRGELAKEFSMAGEEIMANIASGRGWKMATGDAIGKAVKKATSGLSDKSAGQVAEILYEQDPKKKYQIVKALLNEAENSKSAIRKKEINNQLKVFYGISDAISFKKSDDGRIADKVTKQLEGK